jgi:DNA modification methylase
VDTKSVPIASLTADPANVRLHSQRNIEAIKGSLQRFGQQKPIVVDEDNVVRAGNGTLDAARALGWEEISIVRSDLVGPEMTAFAIADNRTAELATWDEEALARTLEALPEVMPTTDAGFTAEEMGELLRGLAEPPRVSEPLAERFGVPPFSVLDARQGSWQERKREWTRRWRFSDAGRSDMAMTGGSPMVAGGYAPGHRTVGMVSARDISLFDPVLAELLVRWFSGKGDRVLDPFAGGPVRGIVATQSGREYLGVDLSQEQVAANEEHLVAAGDALQAEPEHREMERFYAGGVEVLSDPLPGGTKERAFKLWAGDIKADTLVYASPREGFAQIAISRVCSDLGKRAVIFVPASKEDSPQTALARAAGATITPVNPGYLTNLTAKARQYCEESSAHLLPFGLKCEQMVEAIATVARDQSRGNAPKEVWCVAGSGTLARGLHRAWPEAKIHAVRIGAAVELPEAIEVLEAPEKFTAAANRPPPFSSCLNYDAKVWQFCEGKEGTFWNVAEEPRAASAEPLFVPGGPTPRWVCGDSRHIEDLAEGPFDLLLACPPYADLEKYSDDPLDLSTMGYAEFLNAYREIIAASVSLLAEDRFAAFVVGDVRNKKTGAYRNLVGETVAAFEDAGCSLWNDAVLLTAVGTVALRAAAPFVKSRKLAKAHQNVLVFFKGDPAHIPPFEGTLRLDGEPESPCDRTTDRHLET